MQTRSRISKQGTSRTIPLPNTRQPRNVRNSVRKPHVPSDGTHEMRRVLAERILGDQTFHLIDWYPSWQLRSKITKGNKMLKEWEENKKKEYTFNHGGDLVLKSTNPTQDEDGERVRQMLESTADQFLAHIGRDKTGSYNVAPKEVATRLFIDKDWDFASAHDEDHAADIAKGKHEDSPTAADVMRRMYMAMRNLHSGSITNKRLQYRTIQIRFMGEIDPDMYEVVGKVPRPRASPQAFIEPLFANPIANLCIENWSKNDMHHHMLVLKPAIKAIVTNAPYILRNPLSMMFARFFFGANEIEQLLQRGQKVEMKKGWEEISRSVFLYEYLRVFEAWERRTVDQVQLTYLHTRALLRDCEVQEEEEEEEDVDVDIDEDVSMEDSE